MDILGGNAISRGPRNTLAHAYMYTPVSITVIWSQINPLATSPTDELGHDLASAILSPGTQRDRLTEGIFLSADRGAATHRLDSALELTHDAAASVAKLRAATKSGRIQRGTREEMLRQAIDESLISVVEADHLLRAEKARTDAIQVDSFSQEEYMATSTGTGRQRSAA